MASIIFTQNLKRHINLERAVASGHCVLELFNNLFDQHPHVRSYILDDTGAVRKHVVVLVNGESIKDRVKLSDHIAEDDEVFVVQALSGG